MLYPRIIPCLLVHNKGLVKTVKFTDPKYVGDPINAVKIFNEKEVDEIIVIDIDATVKQLEPDYKMIENLAAECRMPLCYGGGIKTVEQGERIFGLGVEKIAISSAAIENPNIVSKLAERVGNQSVVVVLDVKKKSFSTKYDIFINNGKQKCNIDLIKFTTELEKLGIGEIVINSIDKDGVMEGYDYELIKIMRNCTNVPMTVIGGAGSVDHFKKVVDEHGIIGVAAGSFFVFKGKYRAVLINYPSNSEKEKIFNSIKVRKNV